MNQRTKIAKSLSAKSEEQLSEIKKIVRSQSDTEISKQVNSVPEQPFRLVTLVRPRLKINESMREKATKSASDPGVRTEKKLTTFPAIDNRSSATRAPAYEVSSRDSFVDQNSRYFPPVDNYAGFYSNSKTHQKLEKINTDKFSKVLF